MSFEQIEDKYNVKFLVGQPVIYGDKKGVITGSEGTQLIVALYLDPADVFLVTQELDH